MNFMDGILQKLVNSSLHMKEDFDKLKLELRNKIVSGSSGGGMVKVQANARFEILNVEIEDSVLKSNDKVMVQELIKSAVNDALKNAEKTAVQELSNLSEKLNIPIDPSMFLK